MLLRILPRFGWLIHPTKCVGCDEQTARFVALGKLVDLAAQKFSSLPTMLSLARDVVEGPDQVTTHVVARLNGLITSSWWRSVTRPGCALGRWTAPLSRGHRRLCSRGGIYAGRRTRRSSSRSPVGRTSVGGCVTCAVSTARPSAPARSRRASTATCSPMPATQARAPSFRWNTSSTTRLPPLLGVVSCAGHTVGPARDKPLRDG